MYCNYADMNASNYYFLNLNKEIPTKLGVKEEEIRNQIKQWKASAILKKKRIISLCDTYTEV